MSMRPWMALSVSWTHTRFHVSIKLHSFAE
jgi:hypothetical protein